MHCTSQSSRVEPKELVIASSLAPFKHIEKVCRYIDFRVPCIVYLRDAFASSWAIGCSIANEDG